MDRSKDTCLSCRIITISCLFGISSYLFYQGKVQGPKARLPLFMIGTGKKILRLFTIEEKL